MTMTSNQWQQQPRTWSHHHHHHHHRRNANSSAPGRLLLIVHVTCPDPWAGGGDPARVFKLIPEGGVWRRLLHFRHSRVQGAQPLRVRRPDDGSFEVMLSPLPRTSEVNLP